MLSVASKNRGQIRQFMLLLLRILPQCLCNPRPLLCGKLTNNLARCLMFAGGLQLQPCLHRLCGLVRSPRSAIQSFRKPALSAAGADHILAQFYSSRALRRLLLGASATEGADEFITKLWEGALDGRCGPLLGTHAEKVLAALAECPCEPVNQVCQFRPLPSCLS